MASTVVHENIPVFISSTRKDLASYRNEAINVLNRMRTQIRGMEYFGSSDDDSLSVCLENVRQSSLLVLILGMRYGDSIDDATGKSFTHLEYEEARRNSIPVLAYVVDKNTQIPVKFIDTGEKAEKLDEFKRSLIKNHSVSFYRSASDFRGKLALDIAEALIKEISLQKETEEGVRKFQKEFQESSDNYDVLRNFINRPSKYSGHEVVVTVKSLQDASFDIKDSIVSALDLDVGDVSYIDALILDEQNKPLFSDKRFFIVTDGQTADELEKVKKGQVFTGRFKLAFCTTIETEETDSASYAKTNSWSALILLAMNN
ncbi:MAG: DUF4062 domain-containing protein [Oscillospiraceae bacterium]|nr:DUF4062 domain-containing protein [Oscillospiraceae bacterium]